MITDAQIGFFRALCAPFPPDQLRTKAAGGGKQLTYVRARTLMNRLDEVAGPDGWFPEYRATERGFICKLHVRVPDRDGSLRWMSKEDGGGFEGMVAKDKTGQLAPDADNDEKTGYTNALRRACACWGLGRYLYGEGVPGWMDDSELPPPADPPRGRAPAREPAPPPRAAAGGGGNYDDFRVPPAGKAVFAWAKRMEEHYRAAGIVKRMNAIAAELGLQGRLTELEETDADAVCRKMIEEIKGFSNYRGEFDGKDY